MCIRDRDGVTGYILKVDRPDGHRPDSGIENYNKGNSFPSKFGSDVIPDDDTQPFHIVYDYPAVEDITKEQKIYISNYINEFEVALASDDFKHPVTGKGYQEYIDVDSFIDFMISNEISNNLDGYRLSTYLTKDVDGKLKMGPIWDFDIAFGNHYECKADLTEGWGYYFHSYCASNKPVPFWFPRMVQDSSFVSKFKERWEGSRKDVLSTERIFEMIDNYVCLLYTSPSPRDS